MQHTDEVLSKTTINLILTLLIIGIFSLILEVTDFLKHNEYYQGVLYLLLLSILCVLFYGFIKKTKWCWFLLFVFFLIFSISVVYYFLTVQTDFFGYVMGIILYSLFDILFFIFVFGTPTRNYFNVHWRKD
jgi:hypothetical protein